MTVSLAALVGGAIAVLLAGVLRGFTGFGVALAGVPLLSLVLEPRIVVPSVMFMQIASGLQNMVVDRQHIEWRLLRLLLPGALIGVWPGLLLLSWLSGDAARLGIGIVVIGTVLLLARGFRLDRMPGTPVLLGLGGASGVLNGFAAIAGPPIIALLFALHHPPERIRATLAAFFVFTGVIGLAVALAEGVMAPSELWLAALLCPPLFLGLALGARLFDGAFRRHYRKVGLTLLLLVGLTAALKGGLGLWTG